MYTYCFPYTLPLFRNDGRAPTRRGRRPRRPLGCHIIWRYMGGETLLTRCRGGCPHPPSRREARNGGEDGWFVQPTFSQTAAQGRAGTPAPTTRLGRVRNMPPSVSSHTICWRGGYRYIYVFRRPVQWRTGDGAPYKGGCVTDVSATITPPGSIRPRGVKRVKRIIG